ncbi:MAG TPA: tetratricopeptide repeat protein [Candidatus Obscuribacterales bacterium]
MSSPHFGKWKGAYINGDDATAAKEWKLALHEASGEQSIWRILDSGIKHLVMGSDEDYDKMMKRGGVLALCKHMLASTEKALGKNNPQYANALEYVGDQYMHLGQPVESVNHWREALSILERCWGKNDARLIHCIDGLANKELKAKQYAAAKAHAERLARLARHHGNRPALQKADALIKLAAADTTASPALGNAKDDVYGDIDQILLQHQRDETLPDKALNSAHFRNWMKAYLAGDCATADREWKLTIKEAGPDVPVWKLLNGAAERMMVASDADYEKMGRRGGLPTLHTTLLASTEKALGPHDPRMASVFNYVGEHYRDLKRYEDALRLFQRGITLYERSYGKDTPQMLRTLDQMARIELKTKQHAQAKAHAQRMGSIARKANRRFYVRRADAILQEVRGAQRTYHKSARHFL